MNDADISGIRNVAVSREGSNPTTSVIGIPRQALTLSGLTAAGRGSGRAATSSPAAVVRQPSWMQSGDAECVRDEVDAWPYAPTTGDHRGHELPV